MAIPLTRKLRHRDLTDRPLWYSWLNTKYCQLAYVDNSGISFNEAYSLKLPYKINVICETCGLLNHFNHFETRTVNVTKKGKISKKQDYPSFRKRWCSHCYTNRIFVVKDQDELSR